MIASPNEAEPGQRKFPRLDVRCRARIRIGTREYMRFVENISDGGAKIRTLTPIRGSGPVYLVVPDLPPIRGQVRWLEPYRGGVCFSLKLEGSRLRNWARERLEKR